MSMLPSQVGAIVASQAQQRGRRARLTSLATLGPEILTMVHTVTGLESAFIAEIDSDADEQLILQSSNDGPIDVSEESTFAWSESLCRRALDSGVWASNDVTRDLPGSNFAANLGIRTYVGAPIWAADESLAATLCAVSQADRPVSQAAATVMAGLARLIADQWDRDRTHTAELQQLINEREFAQTHLVELAESEHRLKTPLAIITGWSETLLSEPGVENNPVLSRGLKSMLDASRKANRQVQQLLEEARQRSLADSFIPQSVDVSALVMTVSQDLVIIASDRHLIEVDIQNEIEIQADPEALYQVIWHLSENAVKYSPEGGRITLIVKRTDDDNAVRVTVTDEGIGLPSSPDFNPFAPFVRGANVSAIVGSGLGLHLVSRLVHAMDGTIEADGRSGQGTQFVVTLPIRC